MWIRDVVWCGPLRPGAKGWGVCVCACVRVWRGRGVHISAPFCAILKRGSDGTRCDLLASATSKGYWVDIFNPIQNIRRTIQVKGFEMDWPYTELSLI